MGVVMRGRTLALLLAVAVFLVGLAAATGRLDWSPLDRHGTGDGWSDDLDWDFADGPHPEGWGWGEWRFVDGVLELDGRGAWAVYFTPAVHDRDFVMEADVQLVADTAGLGVRAHLLTRDSNQMNHEAGIVLATAPDKVAIRHMVNGTNSLHELVPSPLAAGDEAWHHLEFAVIGGLVTARIDGEPVFRSEEPVAPGYYTEPHLAAERGIARFRNIRIRSSSGTRPQGAPRGNAEAEG